MFVSFLCTLIIFLLAIVIALFVIIAFARILCSRAIYVFLRVSYFVFIFILSSVVYLYPSEMFKDLSARFSKISHESEVLPNCRQIAKQISPPFVGIVKKFSLSLRVLLSMKFGFKNLCREVTKNADIYN